MTIDTREQPIKISSLLVAEPVQERRTAPFDPRVDISDQEWSAMRRRYQDRKDYRMGMVSASDAAVTLAAHMHLLQHDTPASQNIIAPHDEEYLVSQNGNILVGRPQYLKVLFPHTHGEHIDKTENQLQGPRTFITHPSQDRTNTESLQFRSVFTIFTLRPEMLADLSDFPGTYDDFRSYLDEFNRSIDLKLFHLQDAAAFKLLFPNKAEEINTSPQKWEAMRKLLDEQRERKMPEDVAECAFLMKILAADKVEMTPDGVKFTMPQAQQVPTESPSVPAQRKF